MVTRATCSSVTTVSNGVALVVSMSAAEVSTVVADAVADASAFQFWLAVKVKKAGKVEPVQPKPLFRAKVAASRMLSASWAEQANFR